jgi:hypothetical protein
VTVERLPRDTIDGRSHCLTLTASRPRRCLKRFATGTHVRGRRPVVRRISMLASRSSWRRLGRVTGRAVIGAIADPGRVRRGDRLSPQARDRAALRRGPRCKGGQSFAGHRQTGDCAAMRLWPRGPRCSDPTLGGLRPNLLEAIAADGAGVARVVGTPWTNRG